MIPKLYEEQYVRELELSERSIMLNGDARSLEERMKSEENKKWIINSAHANTIAHFTSPENAFSRENAVKYFKSPAYTKSNSYKKIIYSSSEVRKAVEEYIQKNGREDMTHDEIMELVFSAVDTYIAQNKAQGEKTGKKPDNGEFDH